MMRLTDVVKNLIILNVAIHLIFVLFFPELKNWLAFHYPGIEGRYGSGFEPFQIITHMFAHDGYSPISTHLLFNMVGLYFFGPPLEALWGPKKFLFYYLQSSNMEIVKKILMLNNYYLFITHVPLELLCFEIKLFSMCWHA